jgi:hypothetical protein
VSCFLIQKNSKAKNQDFFKILVFGLFCCFGINGEKNAFAGEAKGLEEIVRLLKSHQPILSNRPPPDRFEKKVSLFPDSKPVLFSIPGFQSFGCGKCHKPEMLIGNATKRMTNLIDRMRQTLPQVGEVPLSQYILQTYASPLLQANQFAHATFDTIRLFPRTVIIDKEIYNQETQFHEILHLTQPFIGHPNELEAYGLNIRSDPRFLFLNFPYFENVFKCFFEAEFGNMLNRFYGRDLRNIKGIPQQIIQFSDSFEPKTLDVVAKAIKQMEPVLDEASKIIRQYPLESAYLSEQTGVRSLMLDLAAVRTLNLPTIKSSKEVIGRAFGLLNQQFNKIDNTSLGYVIDRKSEALMILKYDGKVTDKIERLSLYFHFLKSRFFSKNGELDLTPVNLEDFKNYVDRKLKNIAKMLKADGISEIEIDAGRKIILSIKKELQAKKEALGVQ